MVKNIARAAARAVGKVTKRPQGRTNAVAHGFITTRCYRDGKMIWEDNSPNIVFNAGLTYALGVALAGTTQEASWFCGLLDASPTFSATNTWTDISAIGELTEYSASTRPTWKVSVTGVGSGFNGWSTTSVAKYTISAAVTCGGVFLCSTEVSGAAGGTIYSGVAFSGGNRILAASDKLEVTYTQSIADDGS
jgi:hypothetical protein